MNANRIAGHTLLHEGDPYTPDGETRIRGSWIGVAKCSCGAVSPVLDGRNQRKRWHRNHKDEIRAAAIR